MINTCDYWENEAVYFEKYIWYNVKNLPSYQMQNIRFYFVYFSSMPFPLKPIVFRYKIPRLFRDKPRPTDRRNRSRSRYANVLCHAKYSPASDCRP